MPIFAWITSLFAPATEILKNLHTSDGDLLKLKNELAKIQSDVQTKLIELEMEKIELQKVEANSTNWVVAVWRPLCSIAIVIIIVAASFGLAQPNQQFYDLAQWFLVGYAGGRSIEKALPGVIGTIGKVIKK